MLPILVFAVTLTIANALKRGNVATPYRQRTQVTMFFFVLLTVGILERCGCVKGGPGGPTLEVPKPPAGIA